MLPVRFRRLIEIGDACYLSFSQLFHFQLFAQKRQPVATRFGIQRVRAIIDLETFGFAYDCSVLASSFSR